MNQKISEGLYFVILVLHWVIFRLDSVQCCGQISNSCQGNIAKPGNPSFHSTQQENIIHPVPSHKLVF